MKIKEGKITILVGQESTTIELKDQSSNTTFAKVTLNPEQLSKALSRIGHVDCDITLFGLDRVGKTMEHKNHEFEVPERIDYDNKTEILSELVKCTLPEGWVSDNYFSSQNTFFKKDGKNMAQVIIRRWV